MVIDTMLEKVHHTIVVVFIQGYGYTYTAIRPRHGSVRVTGVPALGGDIAPGGLGDKKRGPAQIQLHGPIGVVHGNSNNKH